MNIRARRLTRAAAITGTALLTMGAGVVALSPNALASGTPRCHTQDLRLGVLADTKTRRHDPGMGHRGATLTLTNISKHTCHVYGYGGLSFVDAKGHVLPTVVTRGNTWMAFDPGKHRVTLAHGARAYSDISWSVVDARTPAKPFTKVRVIPPDETKALTTAMSELLGDDGHVAQTAWSRVPATLRG